MSCLPHRSEDVIIADEQTELLHKFQDLEGKIVFGVSKTCFGLCNLEVRLDRCDVHGLFAMRSMFALLSSHDAIVVHSIFCLCPPLTVNASHCSGPVPSHRAHHASSTPTTSLATPQPSPSS